MTDEVIPGIVMAAAEGRIEDAAELASILLEERSPESAVIAMAIFAKLLHASPGMPLTTIAAMSAAQDGGWDLTAEHLTGGVLMQEILDVVETWGTDGPSPEGAAILERFDSRPGSAEVMRHLCQLIVLLLSCMKLQMTLPLKRRSPDAAERYSFAHARAVATESEQPNVFSEEWNDLTDEDDLTNDD